MLWCSCAGRDACLPLGLRHTGLVSELPLVGLNRSLLIEVTMFPPSSTVPLLDDAFLNWAA